MIPKIIHYCWYGNNPKSEIVKMCVKSWKTHCPDFEIREWNDTNTRVYQNKFYQDAFRKRKFAFVSDCVRSQVLFEHGGIYLDTDMLLLKPIDVFLLNHDFFTGYEVDDRPAYGFYGAIPGHRFLKEMLDFYNSAEFNEFSLPVITHTFKSLINEDHLKENEHIFPIEYFYPMSYENKEKDYNLFVTQNSYAVHLWDHSWNEQKQIGPWLLLRNINTVLIDYFFYRYSKHYMIRYVRGFSRQLYHYFLKRRKE